MDRGGSDGQTFYYSNLAVDLFTGASLGVSVHLGDFHQRSFAFEDVHTFNSANPNDSYDNNAFAAAKDGSQPTPRSPISLGSVAFPHSASDRSKCGGRTMAGIRGKVQQLPLPI